MLRPVELMNGITKDYKDLNKNINIFISDKGAGLPDWPEWCFLPVAAWYSIVSNRFAVDFLSPQQSAEVAKIAAVGTWRYSQGYYDFDPWLYAELAKTEMTDELPVDVLYRLPEWCVYIKTPFAAWFNNVLFGFFASLEYDVKTQKPELRLLLDTDVDGLISLPLHIEKGNVKDAIQGMIDYSAGNFKALKLINNKTWEAHRDEIAQYLSPILSAILYLCSNEPELDSGREKGKSGYAKPKSTKGGKKFFPAEKPVVFKVGTVIGEKLREYEEKIDNSEFAGKKRPHLRRAHYHGFWTEKGRSKFVYKWIAPVFVGGE